MPPALRIPLLGAAIGVAAFGLALGGGFLVGHQPGPSTVAIRLEPPQNPPTETLHQGVVSSADDATLQVSTANGARQFDLRPDTPVEDLSPLGEAPAVAEGAPVNVGGERTNNGYVLTGVVVLEATP